MMTQTHLFFKGDVLVGNDQTFGYLELKRIFFTLVSYKICHAVIILCLCL